jgi:hypothetical protein
MRTRVLLAAAAILSGILAGTVVDRAMVGGPAWQALGAEAWAQFSRQADLGTGLIAYPVEAIGTSLLLIAAAVSRRFDGDDRAGAAPLVAAIALSLLGLLLTMKAAPIMLSLGAVQQAGTLQRAFDEFFFWGLYLRGAVYVLAFVASVWGIGRSFIETHHGPEVRPEKSAKKRSPRNCPRRCGSPHQVFDHRLERYNAFGLFLDALQLAAAAERAIPRSLDAPPERAGSTG